MSPDPAQRSAGCARSDGTAERNVALIGHGAITRAVLDALGIDAPERIGGIVVRQPDGGTSAFQTVARAADLDRRITLVVEAAGGAAVREHGAAVLQSGRDLAIVSTASLADDELLRSLRAAAREHGRALYALSGAIGALDVLGALRAGGLSHVRYIGRKPPRAWLGTPAAKRIDLSNLENSVAFFEGRAREAVTQFPQNANVAATVALAGLGFDRTIVKLVAAPGLERNVHRIEAGGPAGEMTFEVEARSAPSNPRTSLLAAHSIVNFLETGSGALRLDVERPSVVR
ncbi:MAG: putative L-aspartate dehydrogenase [Betaproteobacteria bacterium]|nr:MAG: putative L-aspartate dehydrogenase [Betaproteobacteria bacterium]